MALDISNHLQQQVESAIDSGKPLNIIGGNSKRFLGRPPQGQALEVSGHTGIINYQPTELVITARAGTALSEIEAALDAEQQMLAFEPPHFGATATIGGTIACGLSGPARPYAGAARDFMLGCKIINGQANILSFGGEVMKNVAGYDVSRLMTGAFGTLGVILEVSLKVLPKAVKTLTLIQQHSTDTALNTMQALARQALPLSASYFYDQHLFIRLSGSERAVDQAAAKVGGENLKQDTTCWHDLKEQHHSFFNNDKPLWRLSVPAATTALQLSGDCLYDWGGTQRWLNTTQDSATIRQTVAAVGGHATLFRQGNSDADIFHPLPSALMTLHQNLKHAFDEQRVFNRGRMFATV